jgi:MoxR-like ATPase
LNETQQQPRLHLSQAIIKNAVKQILEEMLAGGPVFLRGAAGLHIFEACIYLRGM